VARNFYELSPSQEVPQFWTRVKYRVPCLGHQVPPDGNLQRRAFKEKPHSSEPSPELPDTE